MDEKFVGGNILTISDETIKNIENLDTQILNIANHSEDMRSKFSSAMTNMTLDTEGLLQKLIQVHSYMGSLGNINAGNIKNIDGLASGLGSASSQAEQAAQNISRAAIAVNALSASLKSSGIGGSVLKQIDILSTKEQVNALKELQAVENERRRLNAESEKQRDLDSRKRINETKIAAQEEENSLKTRLGFLKEEGNQLKMNSAELNRYTSAMAMSESTEDSRLKKIERLSAIQAEMRNNEARYAKELDLVSRKIESLTRENERLAEARRKAAKEKLDLKSDINVLNAYNRAMSASEASLNQKLNKIVKLKYAQDLLTKSEKDYSKELAKIKTEIDRINKAYTVQLNQQDKVKKSHSKLLDTAGQLQRKLALLFSVSQIQGYVMNVVKVTGEFEKQNTALASILQNKEKADKLFAQVTELAVRSPFQLKELVTYTKSLSAYQIEYEKLFDTTKRLADVSAGLGVDMQRLILAYGQIKSANYLRGTEVRQLTEAGFNILGELSKYYTELEGRMVSVGEVQERVTKRMVAFGDVEEIFKRVTSAGGIFYKMQETQAETIAGQMSNLSDSVDIMLNSIGSANSTTIKDAIGYVRELLQNWRDLAFSIRTVALEMSPLIAYLVLAKISSTKFGEVIGLLGKSLLVSVGAMKTAGNEAEAFSAKARLSTMWTKAWHTALKGIASLGVGLAIGGIVFALDKLIINLTRSSRMANELEDKLSSLLGNAEYDAAKLANGFRRLAEKILDSNTSVDEQAEALQELKRTYGEYLPSQTLTIKGLEAMKGVYDSVTRAIYAKIEAQLKEKQINTVSETYGRDVEVYFNKVKSMLEKLQGLSSTDATKVVLTLRQALEEGRLKIGDDYTKFVEDILRDNFKMNSKIRTAFKKMAVHTPEGVEFVNVKDVSLQNEVIEDFANSVFKLVEQINNIKDIKPFSFGDSSDYQALEAELEKQKELILNARKEIAQKYKGEGEFFILEEQDKKEKEILQNWIKNFKATNGSIHNMTMSYLASVKDSAAISINVVEELKKKTDAFKYTNWLGFSAEEGPSKLLDAYGNLVDGTSKISLKFIEDLQNQINSVDGNPMQKEVRGIIRDFNELNDINLVKINDVLMKSSESMGDYRKRVESTIKEIKEKLEQYANGYSGFITQIFNDEDETKARQTLALLQAIQLSLFPKYKSDKEDKAELRVLKEKISLIKKAGQEYEKFRKYYSMDDSTRMVRENFGDAFNDLGLSISMDFDPEGVYDGIKRLGETASKEGVKVVDKELAEIESKKTIKIGAEGIEEIKKEIDDIFSNYEFNMDIQSSGVNLDEFKNLLKSVGADDEMISSVGLDTTTFEETVKKLEDKKKELLEQDGKGQVEEAEKLQKRITTMTLNEARKRFDELAGLREKYQDNDSKISKIRGDIDKWNKELKSLGEKATEEEKELLQLRIKNGEDAITRLESEALQLTSFWRRLFGDLGDLSVKSLRGIMNTSKQVLDSVKEIRDDNGKIMYSAEYVDDKGITKKVKLTVEQYQRLLKQNNKVADQIAKKNPFLALTDAIRDGKMKDESSLDYLQRLSNIMTEISKVTLDTTVNIAKIFGAEGKIDFVEEIEGMVEGITNIGLGTAKMMSGDILGGTVQTIQGLAQTMESEDKFKDKKREKKIKKMLKEVDALQHAYEKLGRAIEAAFDSESLDKYTKDMNKNLEEQNKQLEAAINKEDDKKRKDEQRMQEWQQQIDENNRIIEENNKKLIESLGGFGTDDRVKSAAEEFVQAWLDAYTEVGNGLDGLQNKMTDWLKSAVQKQLLVNLSKKFIAPILEQFDAMFKEGSLGGSKLLPEEAAAWKELYEKKSEEFNEAAKAYLEALKAAGIDLGSPKGDELSGLQKGIQGITEQTAEALEAITESIRFFVSDSNLQLKTILNTLINPPVENPFIYELKLQTEQMRMMYSLWSSLTMTKAGVNGKCLKINIV